MKCTVRWHIAWIYSGNLRRCQFCSNWPTLSKRSASRPDRLGICQVCQFVFFVQERDKLFLPRCVVLELIQALKFKMTLPDENLILLVQVTVIVVFSQRLLCNCWQVNCQVFLLRSAYTTHTDSGLCVRLLCILLINLCMYIRMHAVSWYA